MFKANSTCILLFSSENFAFHLESVSELHKNEISALEDLLQSKRARFKLPGPWIGPRREMISPWSTNAVEITRSMGICGVIRLERFVFSSFVSDPLLEELYEELCCTRLLENTEKKDLEEIPDISSWASDKGLALSPQEIIYLEQYSKERGKILTDAEVLSFAQINSEHCRHKIFNGKFIIDGQKKTDSLFSLIKKTSQSAPNEIISAYSDNVAFVLGTKVKEFAPEFPNKSSLFCVKEFEQVISLKAETHNFPTTVEPFYGASTGSGGEIRDRMAGGRGSHPLSGSAVYMTAFPRIDGDKRKWILKKKARPWKYQTPEDILIKASNGASDFGNKFGQPLTCGSLVTYEGEITRNGHTQLYAYDRTVMMAGGTGMAALDHAQKLKPRDGDIIVMLGGDNYRIGLSGGSVSSVDSGKVVKSLELSAVQRANPEIQKRVYNLIRALSERSTNPIRSIHDHGAGGHANCFSELLEGIGGVIELGKLPIGDPSLSDCELIANESQERMGLIVAEADFPILVDIARREKTPIYAVGRVGKDGVIAFERENGFRPFEMKSSVLFGEPPELELVGNSPGRAEGEIVCFFRNGTELCEALHDVLSLESVGSKDWLTNKVDRSVTGRVAMQQCTGPFQLPLNNLSISTCDFSGKSGIANSIGHAPVPGLIEEASGSELAVLEALTNIVWAPLEKGLSGVSLSANWMWPAGDLDENARLYNAVNALSKTAIDLGIPVPTGKDSLSMTMHYEEYGKVKAPGTVIVSATALVKDIRKSITPDLVPLDDTFLYLIYAQPNLAQYPLGGSAYALVTDQSGGDVGRLVNAKYFKNFFFLIQNLIFKEILLSGHDISAGGCLSQVVEMAIAGDCGVKLDPEKEFPASAYFSEFPSVIIQISRENIPELKTKADELGLSYKKLGEVILDSKYLELVDSKLSFVESLDDLAKSWYLPSALLEKKQSTPLASDQRRKNWKKYPLKFSLTEDVRIALEKSQFGLYAPRAGCKAAVIREKGINGDREMALSLYAAGFDVIDITMYDLIEQKITLEDISFIVFPGGFSNSDVTGAARGWAAAFKHNANAKMELENFYSRSNTLSLGVCNGCQLMGELDLLSFNQGNTSPVFNLRQNDSKKFESAFISVSIEESPSIMLKPLLNCLLGVWVAHREGKFCFEGENCLPDNSVIPMKYSGLQYPQNPNGSPDAIAALTSTDGRHLAMMPHLERSVFPWQWAWHHDMGFKKSSTSPWSLAFEAAREWVLNNRK